MSLPEFFPDHHKTQKLIDDLLTRVRNLDPLAKKRLMVLLEDEADLPMLDKLERNYRHKVVDALGRMSDRKAAGELGNALRAHFNRNLTLQRQFLHDCVRKELQDSLEKEELPVHTENERD